ncbi:MAG TPA: DUF4089 domain-containing protein [Stellaceae bacterium]|nr:DUF4089 domain-containing protein [Stellaceae bacterium]
MKPDLSPDAVATVVEANAAVIGLTVPPEYRQGVIDNYARMLALAGPVMAFELPKQTEMAPVFTP